MKCLTPLPLKPLSLAARLGNTLRGLAAGLILAACTALPTLEPAPQTPPPQKTETPVATPAAPTAEPVASTTTLSGTTTLRLWVPPQFAPETAGSAGGQVLAQQLAQFEQTHANIAVETRIKAETGTGGLLHALTTAYNVAPAILPNIVALNHDDLTAAAAAGLVLPLDKFFPPDTLGDYYSFAQQLGQGNDGKTVGLPFAADAQILVYNAGFYLSSPITWTTVSTGTFIFPAAEPSGLTLLDEYVALGGPLSDSTGKLAVKAETLTKALTFFRSARDAGLLPVSSLAYADPLVTGRAFQDGRATLAVTSANWYLAEGSQTPGTAATLIPAPGGAPLALAKGWSWALVNTAPEHQAQSVALLTWLTGVRQLATWTQAANVLPTRVSVLAAWASSPASVFAETTLPRAQLQPPSKDLNVLGPLLQQALADVLNERATPSTAALAVTQALSKP